MLLGYSTLNSEEIKPVAVAIIVLRLSDSIGKSVSRLVKQSVNWLVGKPELPHAGLYLWY